MKKFTVLILGMFLVVSVVAFSGCAKKSAPKAPVAATATKAPATKKAATATKAPATKKAATATKVKS